MNPDEQHDRHRNLGRINQRIDTLAEAVDAEVAEQFQEMRCLIARLLTAEHAERLTAEQQNQMLHLAAYATTARNTRSIVTLNFYASQFLQMNLRERLRWTFLGTLPEHLSEFAADPEAALLSEPEPTVPEPSEHHV
jgi:hypothetical protein